ncbi:leucine-rich repeat domain-containing protein [Akkermansiaceae bacterium]|nr:leucine-rich repeat domain-containing protein [Akkermansiaceae bacterium]
MKPLQALLALFACAFLPLQAASLDDLIYTTTDGEVTITDCDEAATGELVIPNTIGGNPVTSIGDFAFGRCTSLTSITIPNSVTSIGRFSFHECSSLTSITIPNGVTSIGDFAFFSGTSLTSISIPDGVNSIGESAFRDCTSLASITIPNSVTSIGGGAFNTCTSLASIAIGNGVTSIGDEAFARCTSLTSITIPDGVTSIGDEAFARCSSLTGITIPDSVTSIGASAFYDCSSLTSISIPDGVNSIGDYAFSFCTSLTSITIPDKFVLSLDIIGLGNSLADLGSGKPDILYPVFNKAVAANDTVSSNTTRIEAIEGQLALLADALAAKDAEIANKNERIAQLEDLSSVPLFNLLLEEKEEQIAALELRPTQAAYDAVVTEKDARPTLGEIQDARTGSVILTPSEDGTVQLKIEIEESSDLEVWENQGKSVEAGFPLAEGKKFLRFALK